jgi:NAD(P)-dependent dehydrogenase (short-subunit alcohol dehydrogenase family)
VGARHREWSDESSVVAAELFTAGNASATAAPGRAELEEWSLGLLEGKVIIVCGAGPSLGQEMVATVLREGGESVYFDLDPANVEAARAALDPEDKHSLGFPADMTAADTGDKVIAAAVDRFGRCDGLIQTAAVFGGGSLRSGDFDSYRRILEVNFFGTLRMIRSAVPAIRSAGGGGIVIIGSVVAIRPALEYPDTMPYAASKGALESAARYIAHEIGPDGIRINTILPGFKWGAVWENRLPELAHAQGVEPDELIDRFRSPLALKRFGDDLAVANAAAFFCSDYSFNITGQQLVVDGGGLLH